MLQFLFYPLPAAIYLFFLAYINHTPMPLNISLEHGTDKAAHFFAYALLSFLVLRTLFSYKLGRFYIPSFLICAVYGAIDEVWQMIVPGRVASFYDFMFNIFGLLAVYIFFWRKNRNADSSS